MSDEIVKDTSPQPASRPGVLYWSRKGIFHLFEFFGLFVLVELFGLFVLFELIYFSVLSTPSFRVWWITGHNAALFSTGMLGATIISYAALKCIVRRLPNRGLAVFGGVFFLLLPLLVPEPP